jgi:hypothetical protein
MLTSDQKKELRKFVLSVLVSGVILVAIVYLFSGSLSSAIPIGIIAIIVIIRFLITDYFRYQGKNKRQ